MLPSTIIYKEVGGGDDGDPPKKTFWLVENSIITIIHNSCCQSPRFWVWGFKELFASDCQGQCRVQALHCRASESGKTKKQSKVRKSENSQIFWFSLAPAHLPPPVQPSTPQKRRRKRRSYYQTYLVHLLSPLGNAFQRSIMSQVPNNPFTSLIFLSPVPVSDSPLLMTI